MGTVVGSVQAVDKDLDPMNQKVVYSIKPSQDDSHGLIDIDRYTGQLKVRGKIDREQRASISMTVMAKNEVPLVGPLLMNPVQPSEASVLITVLNENDHKPEFIPDDSFQSTHLSFIWEKLAGLEQLSPRNITDNNSTKEEQVPPTPPPMLPSYSKSFCDQIPYRLIDRDNMLPQDLE
ncbi:hypothetical protein Ciccas_014226, partial [Cichlidogyrus casuarinus]